MATSLLVRNRLSFPAFRACLFCPFPMFLSLPLLRSPPRGGVVTAPSPTSPSHSSPLTALAPGVKGVWPLAGCRRVRCVVGVVPRGQPPGGEGVGDGGSWAVTASPPLSGPAGGVGFPPHALWGPALSSAFTSPFCLLLRSRHKRAVLTYSPPSWDP